MRKDFSWKRVKGIFFFAWGIDIIYQSKWIPTQLIHLIRPYEEGFNTWNPKDLNPARLKVERWWGIR